MVPYEPCTVILSYLYQSLAPFLASVSEFFCKAGPRQRADSLVSKRNTPKLYFPMTKQCIASSESKR